MRVVYTMEEGFSDGALPRVMVYDSIKHGEQI